MFKNENAHSWDEMDGVCSLNKKVIGHGSISPSLSFLNIQVSFICSSHRTHSCHLSLKCAMIYTRRALLLMFRMMCPAVQNITTAEALFFKSMQTIAREYIKKKRVVWRRFFPIWDCSVQHTQREGTSFAILQKLSIRRRVRWSFTRRFKKRGDATERDTTPSSNVRAAGTCLCHVDFKFLNRHPTTGFDGC